MELHIRLSPQAQERPEAIGLSATGATLSINGAVLDLSFLGDGDTLPRGAIDHPLLSGAEIRSRGEVVEIDGLLFPISTSQSDPAACYPEPILVIGDGPIPLPPQFPPASDPTPETEQREESSADHH